MNDFPHSMLEESKTQAAILLKQLRSDDKSLAMEAALRFQALPHLCNMSGLEIVDSENVKLKHALAVIAQEHGFETWAAYKQRLDRKERLAQRRESYYTLLYPLRCSGYVLEWHANYEVASQELGRIGGYLLPYKNQFFICEAEYIIELGLDPDDPDWERIGYNWVKPTDQAAWHRLNSKLHEVNGQTESNHDA